MPQLMTASYLGLKSAYGKTATKASNESETGSSVYRTAPALAT